MNPPGNYQLEIYFQALSGVLPTLPMSFAELEARAESAMPPTLWTYVAGGAGDERTQRVNAEAFSRWGLIPRMLVGAAGRPVCRVVGPTLAGPGLHGPGRVIGLCTTDRHGDLAAARAAARTGVPMCVSTLTMDPLEDVAAELVIPRPFPALCPRLTESWPKAWCAGQKLPAIRESSSRWTPGYRAGGPVIYPRAASPAAGLCLANYISDPVFRSRVGADVEAPWMPTPRRCSALGQHLRKPVDVEGLTLAAVTDRPAAHSQRNLSSR